MNEHVATCMQQAIDYLTENPDQARYTDSAATATLEEGLRKHLKIVTVAQ